MGVPESLSAVKRDKHGLPYIWRKFGERILLLTVAWLDVGCDRGQGTEQAVITSVEPLVEKERVCGSRGLVSSTKGKPPETFEGEAVVLLIAQFPLELASNRIKGQDLSASKLANQNSMAECAKIAWSEGKTPRGIEPVAMLQAQ